MFVHELEDAENLFRKIGDEKRIDPYLVEKDYWIMHALWGLQNQGYEFELKGGTSLSKGFKIIDRFSEDIDIKIMPKEQVPQGRNQNKRAQVEKRKEFFDSLSDSIEIPGMKAERDNEFDNEQYTSAGIRLTYESLFGAVKGIKEGVLLEAGFDTTTPNELVDIDSWAYVEAVEIETELTDNIARQVKCYLPEYTFVEKLQTITRKVRQQKDSGEFSTNFLRHFYDIHQLFKQDRVKEFIGSKNYLQHKNERFRGADNIELKKNLAFNLDSDAQLFELYKQRFLTISSLFILDVPTFDEIYSSIVEIREIG